MTYMHASSSISEEYVTDAYLAVYKIRKNAISRLNRPMLSLQIYVDAAAQLSYSSSLQKR